MLGTSITHTVFTRGGRIDLNLRLRRKRPWSSCRVAGWGNQAADLEFHLESNFFIACRATPPPPYCETVSRRPLPGGGPVPEIPGSVFVNHCEGQGRREEAEERN